MKYNELSPEEEKVIIDKGTETPHTGKYEKYKEEGIYTCRRCNAYLYNSTSKFDSDCGWPSFDDEINGAVKRTVDSDGSRTEITCERCDAHLGHVFLGEQETPKNVRHCVNSVSMIFISKEESSREETIYLGGGCYWCTEAVFKMLDGIKEILPGYAGGHTENPTHNEVDAESTGHTQTIKIVFDPTITSLEQILEVFFETHEPTSINKQGNDVGPQYRSAIFCTTEIQKGIVEDYIKKIQENYDKDIVTEVMLLSETDSKEFYEAADYHKNYYENHKDEPYCKVIIAPKLEKAAKIIKKNN